MKKILCYGDSNTYGFNPLDGSRYDVRWTTILQKNLGAEYEVIEEGGCDRTGFVSNLKGFAFSAQEHFPTILYENVDILILAIGTNDLQFQYDINDETVENGLKRLISIAKTKTDTVILIPPVVLDNNILDGYFRCQFDETSVAKSKNVGKIYKKLALEFDCKIFDINEFAKPSDIDGLHYDITSHNIIANKLCEYILKIS